MKRNNTPTPIEALYDTVLISEALKRFELTPGEAFRLDAMRSQCRTNLAVVQELTGPDWHAMTVRLLFNGFIKIPSKGPAQLTSKALRFLAICDTLINKN